MGYYTKNADNFLKITQYITRTCLKTKIIYNTLNEKDWSDLHDSKMI